MDFREATERLPTLTIGKMKHETKRCLTKANRKDNR